MGPEWSRPQEGEEPMEEGSRGKESEGASKDISCPVDSFASICREFFHEWQRRNECLREHWNLDEAVVEDDASSLDMKLLYLKREIGNLVAQDTSLFEQLFQLHEAMEELKEQMDCESCISDDSSQTSSISSEQELPESSLASSSNPSTPTSTHSCAVHNKKSQQRRSLVHHTSFVRQRISYPPTARNRYPRTKGRPTHQSQGSYDSGIHTPDHEIFV